MNTTEIQERLNRMPAAMSAKGKPTPVAVLQLNANASMTLMLTWKRSSGETDGYGDHVWHHIDGGDAGQMLDNADQFIASLPSIEEAKLSEFTNLLAQAIELGNAHGIDVQFVNPLTEAMKRLSANALTHQPE